MQRILRRKGWELHALTNWSDETFPIARRRFEFLEWFEHIVVSGGERVRKPRPRIFEILLERIGRTAPECLFIDDSRANIATASALGFTTILFTDPEQLRRELAGLDVLDPGTQT